MTEFGSEKTTTEKYDDLLFTPLKDITAYELALLLKMNISRIHRSTYNELPVALKRHFTSTIIDPS